MSARKGIYILLIILLAFFTVNIAIAEEERSEGYFTVKEERTEKEIFITARAVNVKDQYLNENNELYEIVRVSGDTAYAKFLEKVELQSFISKAEAEETIETLKPQNTRSIAIYHTHSDESYIPTDGESSIKYKGGIFKVGETFAQALEEKGIKAIHSYQSHDPHDAMAYKRSRNTAVELLKKGPDAIIDVHRDAVPPEVYNGNVKGKPIAKMQLVVGRQNPQIQSIDNFAKQIKANADKQYPGLVKGIFYGQGAYNQDLFPRAILIEAGTYTNPREHAQEGIRLMADVIATTIYGPGYYKKPASKATTKVPRENQTAFRGSFWIIGVFAIGLGIFLAVSTGGIKELSSKVKGFVGSEFSSFLGKRKKGHKPNDKRD